MSIEPSNQILSRPPCPTGSGGKGGPTTQLKVGIVGTTVAALCCFTPVLVVLLGAVGLAAVTAWLDYLLLPALVFFLVMTGYALWKRQTRSR